MEEPLVPTQLDIFRLLELPLVLQLPLPFGEEVEPPREDELELLRVCKNKKHALTDYIKNMTRKVTSSWLQQPKQVVGSNRSSEQACKQARAQ